MITFLEGVKTHLEHLEDLVFDDGADGLGRAVAWTSDASGRWAADWLGWSGFNRFFSQLVAWTFPGEESGGMEAELVDWREANDSRLPIVAFMAGKFMDDEEMQGMSFGHAGTIVEGKEDSATEKIARLEAAGIPVVERIDEIPDRVKEKLGVTA